MSLTVGINSYITLAEAADYVNTYYLGTDPLAISWNSASDKDKEVYLVNACQLIETLPFRGRKLNRDQTLSFPREDGKMEKIKIAQAMQALALTDILNQEEKTSRKELQIAGVKSYSIGNLSETFGSILGSDFSTVDYRAINVLKPYLTGGYRICI